MLRMKMKDLKNLPKNRKQEKLYLSFQISRKRVMNQRELEKVMRQKMILLY